MKRLIKLLVLGLTLFVTAGGTGQAYELKEISLNELGDVWFSTGKFSDRKIFVSELSDAVRIRTGQRGVEAIMDIPGEKPA